MIKVSVIIPVYNMEKYLDMCLNSVCEQNLNEIEIICINDGSKDLSLKILEQFEQKSDKIRIVNQMNQGVSTARNNGLKVAQGEFVAFMDADDFYPSKDVLSLLYNTAKEQNVLVCGGSIQRYDEINGIKEYKGPRMGQVFEQEGLLQYKDYQEVYGYTRFLYNKKMLLDNDILFPDYIRYQDPPFFLNAMIVAKEFYVKKNIVYCVRTVDKRISYDTPQVLGAIGKAFRDMLQQSEKFELRQLHIKLLEEFIEKYEYRFYKEIYLNNTNIELILEEINRVADWELFFQKNQKEHKFFTKEQVDKAMNKIQMQKKELNEEIERHEEFIIYGAGMVGKVLFDYLLQRIDKKKIKFAVTEKKNNNITVRNIQVQEISEMVALKKEVLVFIAATENHQSSMKITAQKLGFENLYVVNFQDILLY